MCVSTAPTRAKAERKKKKSGAAASHAKVAERLLAAQMRREALEHASGKGYVNLRGRVEDDSQRVV